MAATILLLLLSATAAFPAVVQRGALDPTFDTVPFDQWLAEGDRAQIPWSPRVYPARLSVHQRLATEFEVRLDAAVLARRRGRGQILIFVQFNDENGLSYRDHGSIDLDKEGQSWSASKIAYTHSAFVLPGDYRVSLAIFDTATSERSVKQERLHVPPLKNDPLSEAWRNLPRVEFRPRADPPDSWNLPGLKGRLHLPIETRSPARIDVIVNLTPEPGAVLPALKTISQVDLRNGSLHVEMFDLLRHRVAYQQDEASDLDWDGIREALAQLEPGRIDVKSLEDRRHNARFFVNEVSRRIGLASPAEAHILIVLSNAVTFESEAGPAATHPRRPAGLPRLLHPLSRRKDSPAARARRQTPSRLDRPAVRRHGSADRPARLHPQTAGAAIIRRHHSRAIPAKPSPRC